jgi:antitoxin YobK
VEEQLGVQFPESYRWFLKEYGGGGAGINLESLPGVLNYTVRSKRFNIPEGFVIIMNCDEYSYCLDNKNMVNGECPVVNWCFYEPAVYKRANSFYEFLLDEIENAIDNDWWGEEDE